MGKVRDIIQTKGNAIYSVPSTVTVYQALEVMFEKNIGALLVIDNGKFSGIFTERHYARKIALRGKSSKETLIGEIMTERPVTVTCDTRIDECMKIMTGKKNPPPPGYGQRQACRIDLCRRRRQIYYRRTEVYYRESGTIHSALTVL